MPGETDEVIIPRLSLHAQVVENLREMIVETKLSPGQRIDEGGLCRLFGISRTPLREALKVLASEGLVDLLPNRSPRVSPLTRKNVIDLFEVLSWLDFEAGILAANKATEKDIKELRGIQKEMRGHYAKRDRLTYYRLNRELHTKIVEIADNSVLSTIYANLMAQAQRARFIAIQSQEHWDRGVQEHDAILEALISGNGKRLGRELMDHVQETGRMVAMNFAATE